MMRRWPASSASASQALLQAHRLSFRWTTEALFGGLEFALPPGVSLVTGDEQSGKTTLLRLLHGELKPQGGELRWAAGRGSSWRTQPEDPARNTLSARQWWQALTAEPGRLLSTVRAEALAEGFGLAPHLEKPLYMLSAGSRRKAELCTAFALDADLILIDNPFAALDAPSSRFLIQLLQEAASSTDRAWVLGDYEAPPGVPMAAVISLG